MDSSPTTPQPVLTKASKVFFTLFFAIIVSSIALTYYKYIILHDFVVIEPSVEETADESQL